MLRHARLHRMRAGQHVRNGPSRMRRDVQRDDR
jgi:hypothetical protein